MRIGFEQTLYSVAESAGVLEISVRVLADENGNIPSIGLPLGVRVTSKDGSAVGKAFLWFVKGNIVNLHRQLDQTWTGNLTLFDTFSL